MGWIEGKNTILGTLKKYKYIVIVLLAGILLMTLPKQEDAPSVVVEAEVEVPDLQESLEEILSQIQGAGSVQVLLTQATGEKTIYQTDGTVSEQEEQRDTVLITNGQREQTGLIQQVFSPVYQGAIVLCQGAEDARVRLGIVEAVMCVTGLTSDHISVLKMK